MKTDKVIYFSFGSANEESKSAGAMYLMVDEIIKRYAQKIAIFDFEGSDVEGIANFNRNFGAKDFVYLRVQKNTLPRIVKWMRKKA
jgi:Holliday junction resolvase